MVAQHANFSMQPKPFLCVIERLKNEPETK